MTICETGPPGVGHTSEPELDGDERLAVLVHHDGTREVYRRSRRNRDSGKLFWPTGKRERRIGSILEGADCRPVEMDDILASLGTGAEQAAFVDPSWEDGGTEGDSAGDRGTEEGTAEYGSADEGAADGVSEDA